MGVLNRSLQLSSFDVSTGITGSSFLRERSQRKCTRSYKALSRFFSWVRLIVCPDVTKTLIVIVLRCCNQPEFHVTLQSPGTSAKIGPGNQDEKYVLVVLIVLIAEARHFSY